MPISESLPMGFKGVKAVTKYHIQRLGIVVEVVSCMTIAIHVVSGQNGYARNGLTGKIATVILVEKESFVHDVEHGFFERLRDYKHSSRVLEIPNMVLLATSISCSECAKTKAVGFADTVIMKPLRSSMAAASLQQVLGIGGMQVQGKGLKGTPFLNSLFFGKNILVVDDNGVNRIVAAFALRKYGANVECAESGKGALSLLQIPHKFDACFMDVQMPEMDGFEATKRIRQLESQANEQIRVGSSASLMGLGKAEWHLPILAMTADLIQATCEECEMWNGWQTELEVLIMEPD